MKKFLSLAVISIAALLFVSRAQAQGKSAGEIRFEVNGKRYTATDVSGNVAIGEDKNAILGLNTAFQEGGEMITLSLDLKKMGAFKPTTAALGPMDNEDIMNFGLFLSVAGDGNASVEDPTAGEAAPKDINADSDKGSFVLTAAVIDGRYATISGHFEFSGDNSIEEGTVKKVSVKGSFKDLRIHCLHPGLLKR
jgi:hypothetical protein